MLRRTSVKQNTGDILNNILIIEDEQAIADAIIHCVEREGYVASWTSLGLAGLDRLKSGEFALVVLDVGLPDINGFELCKHIRAFSDVPIIFLTARNDEVDRIVGLEIGADDYVSKPFSPRELGARIKTVLRRARSAQGKETAAINDGKPESAVRIDREKMSVVFKGQKLELTRYEFRIISLLAKNPGRVYTRDMLLENVWDDSASSFDRTVDAHIKSIRAKFKAIDSETDPFVTHRGAGYSFREDL